MDQPKEQYGDRVKQIIPSLMVLLFTLLIHPVESSAEMQSTSYHIPSSTLSGGGSAITSTSYQLNASIGQSTPATGTSNSNLGLGGGFWRILQGVIIDSDGDGIDDQWEQDYFGNLSTADATSDFDRDGYSDLQEYLNSLVSETDPAGGTFNPKSPNVPWGTGYDHNLATNILLLVLPAIISGGK